MNHTIKEQDKEILLNFAVKNGIINIDNVLEYADDMKKKEIITQHPYDIWEASDGRWKTYIKDTTKKNKRKLIARSSKEKIYDVIIKEYKNNMEIITFEKAYRKWLEYGLKNHDIEKGTVDRYECDYKKYYAGTKFVQTDISLINEKSVIDFLKNILNVDKEEDKIKRKAFVNIKSIISSTFKFAKTELEISCIPISETLNNLKFSSKKFKPHIVIDSEQVFNDMEVMKIARYIAQNYNNTRQLGVLFALLTGVRVGELSTIKTTDIVNNMLYIKRTEIKFKDENGKTIIDVREYPKTESSIAGVELSKSAMIVLLWIRKWNLRNQIQSEWLFYDKRYGRIKSRSFDKQIRNICKSVNIPVRSMHKLRKTYASNLFANNVEESIVQSQMRHKDKSTTHRYYDFSTRTRDYKREQLNKADFLQNVL